MAESDIEFVKEAMKAVELSDGNIMASKPSRGCLCAYIREACDWINRLQTALDYAKNFIDGYGAARIKENLGRDGMDAVLKEINKIIEGTDICPICLDEKPISDLHRNCGK